MQQQRRLRGGGRRHLLRGCLCCTPPGRAAGLLRETNDPWRRHGGCVSGRRGVRRQQLPQPAVQGLHWLLAAQGGRWTRKELCQVGRGGVGGCVAGGQHDDGL